VNNKLRKKQVIFVRKISFLSPEFELIFKKEKEEGFDDIPQCVMGRYVDYIFKEFNKSNFLPMNIFLNFCEKNIDDSICDLIRITLGESLIYSFRDRIYADYIERIAGVKTKKCLEIAIEVCKE